MKTGFHMAYVEGLGYRWGIERVSIGGIAEVHASPNFSTHYREGELLPALCPASRALLRSQSGTHAGAWLTITPCEPAMTLEPQAMQLALRRRLRLPLPPCPIRCGPGPGCGQRVDPLGDHALACPRTGLLARRAKTVERAWVRVAREAVGPDGQVVPQQWLAHTTAPGIRPDDRRRLDLVVYGATPRGGALCCDATLVPPLSRTGPPQPGAAETDGSALRTAERRKHATYPELRRAGPQRLLVLGSEVGGRWNGEAARFVRDLVRVRAHRAPGPAHRQDSRRCGVVQALVGYAGSRSPASGRKHGPLLRVAGATRTGWQSRRWRACSTSRLLRGRAGSL